MLRETLRFIPIGVFVLILVAVCGCTSGSPVNSPAATDAANATADRILGSINSGNYSDFTANYGDKMMSLTNESQFNDTRSFVRDNFGDYVSRSAPKSSVIQGFNVFVYDCTFTKGHMNFQLTMNMTNTSQVDGVFFRKQ